MKNSHEKRESVRENGKAQQTSRHDVNLRKNSGLFFQVGLIVALLFSLFAIEYQTPISVPKYESVDVGEMVKEDQDVLFTVDRPQPKPTPPPKPKEVKSTLPPVIEEDEQKETKELEDQIFTPVAEGDKGESDADVIDYKDPSDGVIESLPITGVQNVPIYPGCERLSSNAERKACMEEKLNRLIRKKFNTGLGDESPGLKRIDVQFTIDENGKVTDVLTRAPDKALEQEAERVINLVPEMQPGMQNNRKVRVIYTQPILFKIER